jgi:hypothetical protein
MESVVYSVNPSSGDLYFLKHPYCYQSLFVAHCSSSFALAGSSSPFNDWPTSCSHHDTARSCTICVNKLNEHDKNLPVPRAWTRDNEHCFPSYCHGKELPPLSSSPSLSSLLLPLPSFRYSPKPLCSFLLLPPPTSHVLQKPMHPEMEARSGPRAHEGGDHREFSEGKARVDESNRPRQEFCPKYMSLFLQAAICSIAFP